MIEIEFKGRHFEVISAKKTMPPDQIRIIHDDLVFHIGAFGDTNGISISFTDNKNHTHHYTINNNGIIPDLRDEPCILYSDNLDGCAIKNRDPGWCEVKKYCKYYNSAVGKNGS